MLWLLPILAYTQNIDISLQTTKDNIIVYQQNKVEQQFQKNIYQTQTCKPRKSFSISNTNNNYGTTNQTLTIKNNDQQIYNMTVQQYQDNHAIYTYTQSLNETNQIEPNNQLLYLLQQKCPQKSELTSRNYWTQITISVQITNQEYQNKNIEFVILFSCDKSFRQLTFDWSLLILLTLSTCIIAFIAKYTRIISYRFKFKGKEFQGIEVNYVIIIFYFVLYGVGAALLISTDFVDLIRYILIIIACFFGTIAIFFVTGEIACLFKQGSFVRNYYIIISILISISIGLPYFFYKPWYLSDIISIAFICLIVKLFRLKNFKMASFLMIANILMDSILALIIHYTEEQSYNTLILEYFNCPFELQLPLIKQQFNKSCAWISLFSQAIPALFLSLAYRIDQSKRTFVYGLFGFGSLIFAELIWVLITTSIPHSYPETLFTYPILLITLSIISIRRAEFKSFWFGNYYTDYQEYRIRGQSLEENNRQLRLLSGLDSIPDYKVQPTDL